MTQPGLPAGPVVPQQPGSRRKRCIHCQGFIAIARKTCNLEGCCLPQQEVRPADGGMLDCASGPLRSRVIPCKRPMIKCIPPGKQRTPCKRPAAVLPSVAARAALNRPHAAEPAESEQHGEEQEQQQYSAATACEDNAGSGPECPDDAGAWGSWSEGGSPEQRGSSPPGLHCQLPLYWEEQHAELQQEEPQLPAETDPSRYDADDLEDYVLRMGQSCSCILVGCSARGVDCLAVPGFSRTQTGAGLAVRFIYPENAAMLFSAVCLGYVLKMPEYTSPSFAYHDADSLSEWLLNRCIAAEEASARGRDPYGVQGQQAAVRVHLPDLPRHGDCRARCDWVLNDVL